LPAVIKVNRGAESTERGVTTSRIPQPGLAWGSGGSPPNAAGATVTA
jgi:hypothetical protein